MTIGLAALLLAGCSGSGAVSPNPTTGGSAAPASGPTTLTIGYNTEPGTLDPYQGNGVVEFNLNVNIGDGLYTTNDKLEPVPQLAESATQVDPLTWEFKLRKGVKFHNGEPFDARSVKASYEYSLRTDIPIKNTWGEDINLESVEIVDDYTVRFHTSEPTPFMLARIANDHFMMPPDWLAKATEDTLAREPVGTGAYRFVSWTPGTEIVLEKNPDYWGDPKPTIDRVVYKILPDESTRVANLRTGAVDFINYVSPSSVSVVKEESGLEVMTVESGRRVYAGINTKLGPMGDVRVRQAINYGANIEAVTQTILAGATSRLTNFVEEGFRDPAVKGYSYDPEKARALLAEAGYPNGIDITWDVDGRGYLARDQFVEAVAASLNEVGIRVTINRVDNQIMTQNQKDRKTNELYIRSNAAYFDPGLTFSAMRPNFAGNGTQWEDPKFLELLDKLWGGGTPEERLGWSHEAQQILMDDAPLLFLWREPSFYGVNTSKVKGFTPPPDEKIRINRLSIGN